MLQKYCFTLTCKSPGKIIGLGGAELHGMLFSEIKSINPEEADNLHNAGNKPFSLSPLYGHGTREKEFFYLQNENNYYFYLSCLNDEMCKLGGELAARWHGKSVRIGSAVFEGDIVQTLLPEGFDFQDLLQETNFLNEIKMDFLSPTSFRSQGQQILFPLPEKVFSSLQNRWNTFSPVKFQNDTDFAFLNVSRYSLRTEMVPFERYKLIGFRGECQYRVNKKYESIMRSRLNALAKFAEIGGCGYKTSMGLGYVALKK